MKRTALFTMLVVGGSIAFLAGCDGSTVPTEPGLADQSVEVSRAERGSHVLEDRRDRTWGEVERSRERLKV